MNLIKKLWQKCKAWAVGIYDMPLHKKIGYLFLLPPIFGVIDYLYYAKLIHGGKYSWDRVWLWASQSENNIRLNERFSIPYFTNSYIPVFLGLMAIAGAYLIKDRDK
jgi:hypothetical protein